MFANIININNDKVIEQSIKNYNLKRNRFNESVNNFV